MKQVARPWFIALLFAALSLPALAAERIDEAPIFYQGYNIGECSAKASGVGKVTASYLYYWDIAAQENRVAKIMNVSSDLPVEYTGGAYHSRNSVTVEIRGPGGLLVWLQVCKH